jgi:hypothetical protein
MHDLGTLGGPGSQGFGINDHGHVTGYADHRRIVDGSRRDPLTGMLSSIRAAR